MTVQSRPRASSARSDRSDLSDGVRRSPSPFRAGANLAPPPTSYGQSDTSSYTSQSPAGGLSSPYLTPSSASSTLYSSGSGPRHRAHTVADTNVIQNTYYQGRGSPGIAMQSPYQPGRGIPPPPPPPQSSQTQMGMSLPPPPPRQPYNQSHSMVPPPPPVPTTPLNSYWARQPTYPPHPMPVAYNPNAYMNYGQNTTLTPQLPPPPTQPPQRQPSETAHLVSATFIPGPDSFGPGVGIPPLYMPSESTVDHSTYFPDSDTWNGGATSSTVTAMTAPENNTWQEIRSHREVTIPGRGNAGYVSPGPPTATLANPQHPSSQDSYAKAPISPSDPAAQWPLDRVIDWLASHGYSREWQETFKTLKIHGTQFLDLGRNQARGSIGFMHQVIIPQLQRECGNSGAGYNQGKEREEGKRLRRLIRSRILEGREDAPISAGGHVRNPSLPSAGADGDLETSPNMGRADGSTPTTAGTGDDSPGRYTLSSTSPATGVFTRRPSQRPNVTMSDDVHDQISKNGRSTYAESMLKQVGDPYGKRHSPSPSRDPDGSTFRRHASPQQSPALQSAHPVDLANGRTSSAGHIRTSSAELVAGRQRHGTEGSRPSPMDIGSFRGDTPGSAKEHKGFFSKFVPRKKKDDPQDESSNSVDSPTSPANHRTFFSKPSHNTSQTSLSSGIMAATGAAVRPVVGSNAEEPKRFAFVTPDGWNYRLVDISYAESPLTLKQTICENLDIPYSPDVTLYITSPAQTEHDEILTDELLIHARRSMADHLGTLKIFINVPTGSVPPSSGLGLGFPNGLQSPRHMTASRRDNRRRGDSSTSVDSQGRSNHSPVRNGRQPPDSRTWHASEASEAERAVSLSHAAEAYRQESERKQKAYLEERKRQLQKTSPIDGPATSPGIPGRSMDFDKRRKTPYDQKDLKPMRDPPPVPLEDTSTLIKANSLTKKGQKLRSSWGEDEDGNLKRRSGGSDRPLSSGSIVMRSSPLRREESNRQGSLAKALGGVNRHGGSPGRSPGSPGFTMSKGKVEFKIPNYEEEPADFELDGVGSVDDSGSQESTMTQTKAASIARPGSGGSHKPELKLETKLTHPGITRAKSTQYGVRGSPEVSPSNAQPSNGKGIVRVRSKRGPTHDFEEADVQFMNRGTVGGNDDGSDSDDGLFAMKIRQAEQTPSTATPKAGPSSAMQDDDEEERRPSLSLNTEKARFASPTRSAVERNAALSALSATSPDSPGDELKRFENDREGVRIPQSAASNTWSPDEPISFNRRESFASDIWANRPPAEALVEHLDEFFPNVNLDQPVMEDDLGIGMPSSPDTSGPSSSFIQSRTITPMSSFSEDEDGITSLRRGDITSMAHRNIRRSGGLGRTKSIRDVVMDAYNPDSARNSFIAGPQRISTIKEQATSAIIRRKSTKMFGAKIEQVKPPRGSRLIQLETIPQDTIAVLARQPTFKWMKGQLIGKGTFGRVYLGMNMTTGELIAVKQVEVNPKAHGQDKEKMKEMVRSLDIEIDTMKDLDHPNIVSYLGSEKKDLSISIFLEYIPGGSVGSCLRKHGKFEEPVVSSLTRQTLSALAYLHREGILHRDLKADNILLDLDGTCKISDFGISKKTDDIYGNDVTNSMQGSVFWMAPEVIRSQGLGYSAKVDVWSLGCVVLEMFAGKRPWSKEEAIGAIYKLGSLGEAPPIPDDVSAEISPQAISFMLDCFTIDPGERPTAETLLRAPFCFLDPRYNFLDTELYEKIRGAF